MKIIHNIRFYLVVTILTIIWLWTINSKEKQINKHQQVTIDSLTNIVFIETNRVGKYEMGLEFLKEIDSSTYKKVNKFIEQETE